MIEIGDRVLCLRFVGAKGFVWLPGVVLRVEPEQQAYQVKLDSESTPGLFFHTEIKSA